MKHTKTTAATLLALALGLSAAQTNSATTPQPGSTATTTATRTPTPRMTQSQPAFTSYKAFARYEQNQQALRALEGATRHAYDFDAQRSLWQNPPAVSFLATAQTLLERAQTSYEAQNFTLSEGQAQAAEALYRAAEHVYAAQGFITLPALPPTPIAPRGPVGPGPLAPPAPEPVGLELRPGGVPTAFEAPFRAQEELDKLGRELTYYGGTDAQIGELQRLARSLLAQSTATQTAANQTIVNQTTVNQTAASQNATGQYMTSYDSSLAYADAAREVAKAAQHLLAAERGF